MDLKKLAEKHGIGYLMDGDDDQCASDALTALAADIVAEERWREIFAGARRPGGQRVVFLDQLLVKCFMDSVARLAVILADRYGGADMVLNESNLRTRIANLKAHGVDTTVEAAALAEMMRRIGAATGGDHVVGDMDSVPARAVAHKPRADR